MEIEKQSINMSNLNEDRLIPIKIMNGTSGKILGHREAEFVRLQPLLPGQEDQDLQFGRVWILKPGKDGGFIIYTSTSNDGYHWKFDKEQEKVYLESNDQNNMANCAFQIIKKSQISPLQYTGLYVCQLQDVTSSELTVTEENNSSTYFQITI